MKTLDESIAAAMTGERQDVEIIPYLPYILQDFWELGTSPHILIDFVQKHCKNHSMLHVLDLGCGKGAVSVKLAEAFQCTCYGIDGIPKFIEAAKEKSREYGVEMLCRFEVGDIREKIDALDTFDILVLGAIGPVFGDYYTTLTRLLKHLRPEGIIIINDAYIDDSSTFQYYGVLPHQELLHQIREAGMELIDKYTGKPTNRAEEFKNLEKRCKELMRKHPKQVAFFENYLKMQAIEYDALENKIVGIIMVLKKCASTQ